MAEKEEKKKDKKKNPYDLLTREAITKAFKADKGDEAILSSFEVLDFTKKGDNYATIVTSVTCHGVHEGGDVVGKYVVKLNPCRPLECFDYFFHIMFVKEGNFLLKALAEYKRVLEPLDLSLDCFPECIYACYEKGNELLFTKDLRPKGFKMYDRLLGMGDGEAVLAFTALARFHATSYVIKKQTKSSLGEIFPFVKENMFARDLESSDLFETMTEHSIDQAIEMLTSCGYESDVVEWLKDGKEEMVESYFDYLTIHDDKFECILHGDFWNNNMVFRYDEKETTKPVEVILLDLQLCRISSVSIDLNYFLYTSFNGYDRRTNFTKYLEIYFAEYSKVIEASQLPMPFDLLQLTGEVRRTLLCGAIQGMMLVPMLLARDHEVLDVENVSEENLAEFMNTCKQTSLKMMTTNPVFKERYLAIFEDLQFYGVIPSKKSH